MIPKELRAVRACEKHDYYSKDLRKALLWATECDPCASLLIQAVAKKCAKIARDSYGYSVEEIANKILKQAGVKDE